MRTIAYFLGQRVAEMADRVALDGMPTVMVPGKTRPARRVALPPFHRWLSERSEGTAMTLQELREELALCERELSAMARGKSGIAEQQSAVSAVVEETERRTSYQ